MSSKRIQKRLDKLFTDINQAEDASPKKRITDKTSRPGSETRPILPSQEPARSTSDQVTSRSTRPEMGTRALRTEPKLPASSNKASLSNLIKSPFVWIPNLGRRLKWPTR